MKEADRERRYFVMMGIAMHPERAPILLKLLDDNYDPNEWAEPIPEESDLTEYTPLSQRPELSEILKDLQSYGMSILEDDD